MLLPNSNQTLTLAQSYHWIISMTDECPKAALMNAVEEKKIYYSLFNMRHATIIIADVSLNSMTNKQRKQRTIFYPRAIQATSLIKMSQCKWFRTLLVCNIDRGRPNWWLIGCNI
eukprot:470003_1